MAATRLVLLKCAAPYRVQTARSRAPSRPSTLGRLARQLNPSSAATSNLVPRSSPIARGGEVAGCEFQHRRLIGRPYSIGHDGDGVTRCYKATGGSDRCDSSANEGRSPVPGGGQSGLPPSGVRQDHFGRAQAIGQLDGRRCVHEADHRHARLLRPRRERPSDCCAGEKGDELAPPHGLRPQAEDHTLAYRRAREGVVHRRKMSRPCRRWVMNRPIGHVSVGSAYVQ
jgi:hypothetical protein